MLIEEVLFSLYDRNQNYSKKKGFEFWKRNQNHSSNTAHRKRLQQHLQYLHLGGLRKHIHFPMGRMKCFFQSPRRRYQNGGKLYFSDYDSTLYKTKLVNTFVTFLLDFYTIETEHLPQHHASKS